MTRASVPSVRSAARLAAGPGVAQRPRLRTLASAAAAALALAALGMALSSGLGLVDMARWAAAQQRAFHTMVSQLLSLQGGGTAAVAALIGACLAYGFVHAAIPGHGKFLIAGAGLGSRMSAVRLVALSGAASLAQALTAIVLVYGSFALLDITAGWAMTATDRVLIPASYLAIMAIAVVLIRRALAALRRVFPHAGAAAHGHDASGKCGCGHRHAPTRQEADGVRGLRDAAMLVAGIGLRPCTGAVFVLVAAWRMDLLWVGVACAVAMAIGTGGFISIVALSAVSARGATLVAAGAHRARVLVPLLQLLAGIAILLIALAFLAATLFPF